MVERQRKVEEGGRGDRGGGGREEGGGTEASHYCFASLVFTLCKKCLLQNMLCSCC